MNGRPTTPHLLVHEGDAITIPEDLPKPIPAPVAPLVILHEEDDVLFIEKPAGLITHPVRSDDTRPSLVSLLLAHDPNIAAVGENPLRPGIVHRLDKYASGVLVVAKTQTAFIFLKQAFQTHAVTKEYQVLVYGKLPKDTGTINWKIGRSKTSGRMAAHPENSPEGKEAITHYEVMERFQTATLIRAHIETGRTHQIRTHFLAFNPPVVGDTVYTHHLRNTKRLALPRLFLHAHSLSLPLPNGEQITVKSPLPKELKNVLKSLSK